MLNHVAGMSEYQIDLQIAADLLSLTGHQVVQYTNQEDIPLDQVYFRLFPNWAGGSATVSEMRVDGQDVESSYEYEDSALRVQLPAPLQPGDAAAIEMNFEVQVAQEMEKLGIDWVHVSDGSYEARHKLFPQDPHCMIEHGAAFKKVLKIHVLVPSVHDPFLAERIIKEADRVAEIVKNLLSFARDQKEEYSPAYIKDIISDTLGLGGHLS